MGFTNIVSFVQELYENNKIKFGKMDIAYLKSFENVFVYIDTISLIFSEIKNTTDNENEERVVNYGLGKFEYICNEIMCNSKIRTLVFTVDGKQPPLKKYTQTQRYKRNKNIKYDYKLRCIHLLRSKLENLISSGKHRIQELIFSSEDYLGEGEHKCIMYRNMLEKEHGSKKNLHIIYSNDGDSVIDLLFLKNTGGHPDSDNMIIRPQKFKPTLYIYKFCMDYNEILVYYWLLSLFGNDYIPNFLQHTSFLLSKLCVLGNLVIKCLNNNELGDYIYKTAYDIIQRKELVYSKVIEIHKRSVLFLFYCTYVIVPSRIYIFDKTSPDSELTYFQEEIRYFETLTYDENVYNKTISDFPNLKATLYYHVFTTLWYLAYITNQVIESKEIIQQQISFKNVFRPDSECFLYNDYLERKKEYEKSNSCLQFYAIKDTQKGVDQKIKIFNILYNIIYYSK